MNTEEPTEKPAAVQFDILPPTSRGRVYKVVAVMPDGDADIDEVDFGGVETFSLERLGRLDPWAFRGRSGHALREHLRGLLTASVAVVEVRLPHGPVAAMNWEAAAPGVSIIRRPHNEMAYLAGHVVTPLRVGICMLGDPSNDSGGIERLLRGQTSAHLIEPCGLRAPDSFDDYLRKLEDGRYQGIHVQLLTEVGPEGRRVRVGRNTIPLETFIAETARAKAHFVFLHDTNPKPSVGISALRWDSQKLPADSASACIMLAATAHERQTTTFLEDAYRRIFHGTPLVEIVAPGSTAERRAIYAGAVANPGVVKALDVETTSSALHNRLRHLQEQRDALSALYPEQEIYRLVSAEYGDARFRSAEVSEEASPRTGDAADYDTSADEALGLLRKLEERVREGEMEVTPVAADVVRKSRPDKPRYPAALFHLVGADGQEDPVPKISSISPPPSGFGLELHFWIDVVKGGIDYKDKHWPSLVQQESSLYPVTLLVDVWSEDFTFSTRRQTLLLPEAGPTPERARFPFTLPPVNEIPPNGKRGEVFIFLQYQAAGGRKELVAVFRVEALMTREHAEKEEADAPFQVLSDAYLASSWFRFGDAPSGSALTIFLSKRGGRLNLFALNDTESPWAQLGATEQAAYEITTGIYRDIHRLSLEAAAEQGRGRSLSFSENADGLARAGYALFSTMLFSAQTDAAVRDFYNKFLASLPEGSDMTIALDRDVNNFIIPWGLMYDRRPPPPLPGNLIFGSPKKAELEGFWGVRFNLSVRPSGARAPGRVRSRAPARMGAAWHNHAETQELEKELKPFEQEGQLVIERVRAEDEMVPALVEKDFDLVQFFCHGYTNLPDRGVDAALVEYYKKFAAAQGGDDEVRQLLMAIDNPEPKSSFMFLEGGAVTLPTLNIELTDLPGRPLVLLSMCESAQVTCAGAGFVTLFLDRGARSVIGTEGPTLWRLGREMDVEIIRRLLAGQSIGQAFSETRRALVKGNVLALIYSLFGDADARLGSADATP
jgi:hypothetical protein